MARLGGSSTSPGPSPSPTPVTPQHISSKPSPQPTPQPKPVATPVPVASTSQVTPVKKVPVGPVKLDQETWEHETIGHVLRVTLDVSSIQYTLNSSNQKHISRGTMLKVMAGSLFG